MQDEVVGVHPKGPAGAPYQEGEDNLAVVAALGQDGARLEQPPIRSYPRKSACLSFGFAETVPKRLIRQKAVTTYNVDAPRTGPLGV